MHARALLFLAAPLLVALTACGGSAPEPASPPPAPVAAKEPLPAALAPGHLNRRDVLSALSAGPGVFLGRVDVERYPAPGAPFRGWRIVSLRDQNGWWAGVDLKPGDIVKSVNGWPIERPEQVMTPWQSLQVASELCVAYERDGQKREIRYAIDDDGSVPVKAEAGAKK